MEFIGKSNKDIYMQLIEISSMPEVYYKVVLTPSFNNIINLNKNIKSSIHKFFIIDHEKKWIEISYNFLAQKEFQRAKEAYEVSAAYRQLIINYESEPR